MSDRPHVLPFLVARVQTFPRWREGQREAHQLVSPVSGTSLSHSPDGAISRRLLCWVVCSLSSCIRYMHTQTCSNSYSEQRILASCGCNTKFVSLFSFRLFICFFSFYFFFFSSALDFVRLFLWFFISLMSKLWLADRNRHSGKSSDGCNQIYNSMRSQ
jgi:hypothetical protein